MSDPLAVRLVGAGVDQHIEHELTADLAYSSSMPGGYKSCSFGLARPLANYPPELYPYTQCIVYDQRDGAVRWAGQLEVPGRGVPSWDVTAVGGAGHTSDRTRPIIYVDSRLSEWERVDDFALNGIPNATVETTGGAGELPALRMSFARGLDVPAGGTVKVRYSHLVGADQGLGRASITHFEGLTTGNAYMDLVPQSLALSGLLGDRDTWSTGNQTLVAVRGGTISSSVFRYVDLKANLWVGGVVGTDVTYTQVVDMVVQGIRLGANGAELVTAGEYALNTVRAHQIVNDLLGRMLPRYYAGTVSQSSTVAIQQAAYADGVTASEVFDDLMLLDPAMRWAAWEPDTSGRWRFEWDTWPNVVTLEADAAEGSFASPGSAADLYNQVQVRWKSATGSTVFSTYTGLVPQLDQNGLVRSTTLDLGSEIGSQAAADVAGPAFLAAHAAPTNNGTLIVSRPIMDLSLGRLLHPWEIVAGPLIRIRNLRPSVDALNATDRDGVSVFRVTEVAYSRRTGRATLTLDSYSDDLVGALARQGRKLDRVRRI